VIHGGEKRAVIERVVLSPGSLILPHPCFLSNLCHGKFHPSKY
jgi:hypothetical protein